MKKKNKTLKKLTLQDLINKKTQSEDDKLKIEYVNCEYLGGSLEVRRLRAMDLMSKIDNLDDGVSSTESFEFMIQLIYDNCPMFKDKTLQEEYECVEPTDIILKLFDDNIGEISKLSNKILDLYGIGEDFTDKVKDKIKN